MFTKSTEYALRASIYIAQASSLEHKLSIQEIADQINAPRHFTAKILQKLSGTSQAIILSRPGPSGGFYMTEEAKNEVIYRIIEDMGEKQVIEDCVLGFESCNDDRPCALHKDYKPIKSKLLHLFKTKTILELAQEGLGAIGLKK